MKNLLFILILGCLLGCTKNQRAKRWGGTARYDLPKGTKLFNITWKDHDLWILTRPMRTNEIAENYSFEEKSSWGLVQGKVEIAEH